MWRWHDGLQMRVLLEKFSCHSLCLCICHSLCHSVCQSLCHSLCHSFCLCICHCICHRRLGEMKTKVMWRQHDALHQRFPLERFSCRSLISWLHHINRVAPEMMTEYQPTPCQLPNQMISLLSFGCSNVLAQPLLNNSTTYD